MTTDPGIVIVGGGLAAQRAVEALRRVGHDGRLVLVGDEPTPPYDRPPLSKAFLAGEVDAAALRYRDDGWYAERDVELRLGARATGLDVDRRTVVLADGDRIPYGRLLIATGAAARRLPGTDGRANVHHLRSAADAHALRQALVPGARIVVIGAGFIGQEVASTAVRLEAHVTMIEAAETPLAAVLGTQLGHWFARLHRAEGVDVVLGVKPVRFHGSTTIDAVELEDGRRIACDAVVVGVGTVPDTAWLRDSGLDPDGHGIQVDAGGRTALPGVFAAGDACRTYDHGRGMHRRTEHWEAAARQGAAVARAMLGQDVPPPATPSFWSDQHGLRIQYVGDAHGADALHLDGDPEARDFTATFTRDGRPVGALLVGRPHLLPETRRRIEQAADQDHERTAA